MDFSVVLCNITTAKVAEKAHSFSYCPTGLELSCDGNLRSKQEHQEVLFLDSYCQPTHGWWNRKVNNAALTVSSMVIRSKMACVGDISITKTAHRTTHSTSSRTWSNRPGSAHFLYSMRQKAGEEPGNEAIWPLQLWGSCMNACQYKAEPAMNRLVSK